MVVNYLFFGGWFIIANCPHLSDTCLEKPTDEMVPTVIVLQMFIAVINEGFEMFEDEKLKEQEARFAQGRQVKQPMLASIIRKINFYRKMKPKPIMSVAHIVPKAAVDSSRQAMLEEYLQGKAEVSRLHSFRVWWIFRSSVSRYLAQQASAQTMASPIVYESLTPPSSCVARRPFAPRRPRPMRRIG